MRVGVNDPCPLPDDPLLAEIAGVLQDTGEWGWVLDANWRLVYVTDEQRLSMAEGAELVPIVVGEHLFSSDMVEVAAGWLTGVEHAEFIRTFGGLVLSDTPGGRGELRALADPSLREAVDRLVPIGAVGAFSFQVRTGRGGESAAFAKAWRIRDEMGTLRGTAIVMKPAAGMSTLGAIALELDLAHLQRMQALRRARRRPAAILFADLEGSSQLARSLSTANYFAVTRRIVGAADRCVIDCCGLVGRHVGDGITAFFPAEHYDSESAAARACIDAALALRAAMPEVAARSDIEAADLIMRFGLHWGSTLYIGNISTPARSEVTALGDEVNEAARIEACATGGRALASKPLVERLDHNDAAALGIDPDQIVYTQLAELPTATDKARRDAPAVAVCEL